MEHMIAHSPDETVWTWRFQMAEAVRLVMPKGTRLLPHAEVDDEGTVQVWGIVHTANEDEKRVRRFHVRGTGHRFNTMVGAGYLATASVTIHGEKFVVHVFVDPDEAPIAGEGEL